MSSMECLDQAGKKCSPELLIKLLDYKAIAVVGMSPKADRASYQVGKYLRDKGYQIFPVNPGQTEILGIPCYPDLTAIKQPVDIVDVFRRPEECREIAQQAVAIGARALWLQEGIVSQEAAAVAAASGLDVVMNCCIKKTRQELVKV
jgi:predicted CoA-binding protein